MMKAWVILVLRILIGLLIIKTGVDLTLGDYAFSGYSEQQPFFTGIFIILIGVHVIFSSIFRS